MVLGNLAQISDDYHAWLELQMTLTDLARVLGGCSKLSSSLRWLKRACLESQAALGSFVRIFNDLRACLESEMALAGLNLISVDSNGFILNLRWL